MKTKNKKKQPPKIAVSPEVIRLLKKQPGKISENASFAIVESIQFPRLRLMRDGLSDIKCRFGRSGRIYITAIDSKSAVRVFDIDLIPVLEEVQEKELW